jgi:hypothetical protein
MKNIIISIVVIGLLGIGAYYFINKSQKEETPIDVTNGLDNGQATTTPDTAEGTEVIIGKSVEGRDITAYNFFSASSTDHDGRDSAEDTKILFVGGIHAGYSSNTVLVAYELMDYLRANANVIPENVEVTVIPTLNPDGQNKIIGTAERFAEADIPTSLDTRISGRFNANNVDLNRNFDCDWQAEGTWQSKTVSGGSEAFSEPESVALRDYVKTHNPNAVVVWYSASGGVFSSSCHNGVLPETDELTTIYADASGYKAYKSFDFYSITGDMVNWLAKEKIPAISVLLTTHEDTEWSKNKAGIEALLSHYAE